MREIEIQTEIMRALGARPDLRLWRRNVGFARNASGRGIRFGVPGEADLQGILAPTGRFFGIEVKSPNGRLTEQQKNWGEMIKKYGGVYCVARSVEDAVNTMNVVNAANAINQQNTLLN